MYSAPLNFGTQSDVGVKKICYVKWYLWTNVIIKQVALKGQYCVKSGRYSIITEDELQVELSVKIPFNGVVTESISLQAFSSRNYERSWIIILECVV